MRAVPIAVCAVWLASALACGKPDPNPVDPKFILSVSKSGAGTGSVDISPPGPSYAKGTFVSLSATAATGSEFGGWSGDCQFLFSFCDLEMNSNRAVTARFDLRRYSLTTTTSGPGSGSVIRSPNSASHDFGTIATLTAVPNAGSTFTAWSGDCSGANQTCSVVMDRNRTVNGAFGLAPQSSYTLTVTTVGNGSVTSSHAGSTHPAGTVVTLTAVPGAGSSFVDWTGACSGSSNTSCAVTMNANRNVTATFTPAPLFAEDFSSGAISTSKWTLTGTGSAMTVEQGALKFSWPNTMSGSQQGIWSIGTFNASSGGIVLEFDLIEPLNRAPAVAEVTLNMGLAATIPGSARLITGVGQGFMQVGCPNGSGGVTVPMVMDGRYRHFTVTVTSGGTVTWTRDGSTLVSGGGGCSGAANAVAYQVFLEATIMRSATDPTPRTAYIDNIVVRRP